MNIEQLMASLKAQEEHLRRSAENRKRGPKYMRDTLPGLLQRIEELKAIRQQIRDMAVTIRIANRVLNEKAVRFSGMDQNPDGVRDLVSMAANRLSHGLPPPPKPREHLVRCADGVS